MTKKHLEMIAEALGRASRITSPYTQNVTVIFVNEVSKALAQISPRFDEVKFVIAVSQYEAGTRFTEGDANDQ